MFEKLKAKIEKAVIENACNKINSLAGDLSVGGYPDEAMAIRIVLGEIEKKKNEAIRISSVSQ